jgi:hypothetical protein
MAEVQKHGFDFENWVKETFFHSFTQTPPSHKWDALDVIYKSKFKDFTKKFSGLPVSIKNCKIGGSVGFGDVIRQFDNKEDFLLIVGFWEQNDTYKNYVAIEAVKILAKEWSQLFNPLSKEQLLILDNAVKDRSLDKIEARKTAQKIKRTFPKTKMTLYPKIQDEQRRVQCGLRSKLFWEIIAKKARYKKSNCELWGIVSDNVLSSPRTFKPKIKID